MSGNLPPSEETLDAIQLERQAKQAAKALKWELEKDRPQSHTNAYQMGYSTRRIEQAYSNRDMTATCVGEYGTPLLGRGGPAFTTKHRPCGSSRGPGTPTRGYPPTPAVFK